MSYLVLYYAKVLTLSSILKKLLLTGKENGRKKIAKKGRVFVCGACGYMVYYIIDLV